MARRVQIPKWEGDAMQLSRLTTDLITDMRKNPDYSPMTTAKYDDDIRQYLSFVIGNGADSVREFTADSVLDFVKYLRNKGVGPASINGKLAALGRLATYGVQKKAEGGKGKYVLDENPLIRVPRLKKREVAIKHLSLDELRDVLAVECPPNERLALMLLVDQPLRVSEWAGAKVGHLKLQGDKYALTVTVKGRRERTKILGDTAAEALVETLRQREAGPEEPLLLNTLGEKYSRTTLSEMVARLARRAGITRIRVSAHVIRHTIASMAAENGASIYEIAEMLNHRNLQTAHRYIHGVRPDAALAGVRALLHAK